MGLKDNKEFITIIIGIILTITIYGSLIGLPLIVIGAYYLNKKAKNPLREELKTVEKEINKKQNELNNITKKLSDIEQEKTKELNEKLSEKQEKLDNIEQILNQKEEEKTREINNKLQENIKKIERTNYTIQLKEAQLRRIEQNINFAGTISDKQRELNKLNQAIQEKQKEYDLVQDDITMQEYGLYEPQYQFTKSEEYKDKLKQVRNQQKQMVKDKRAALCNTEWTVEGSKKKGQAMTNQNIKQAIYTFNIESQQIISQTRPSNVNKQKDKITKVYERINKMNDRNKVFINKKYLDLKYDELQLAVEYEMKKQEEKEILREAREREKEERKVQRELERKEKAIQKQKTKLQRELEEKQRQAEKEARNEQEKQELLNQIKALQQQITKQEQDQEDIENKRLRTGAGFVYIISNIGSFGEGVYKIGVTRRDDPEARVNELSNASVPFKYDVHAFIFSNNAFDLETELHQKYDYCRVNKVNNRKEFFKLTKQDIQDIVNKNKNSTYNFTLQAEALEYYETLEMEKQQQKLYA